MKFGEQVNLKIKGLTIFRTIMEDEVIIAFMELMSSLEKNTEDKVDKYANFTHKLFKESENFTSYVWNLIICNENIYVKKLANRENISSMMQLCVEQELNNLQYVSTISSDEIKKQIQCDLFLPKWETNVDLDFNKLYDHRINNLFKVGYGVYTNHNMFIYNKGEIVPVKAPDNIRLKSLTGYENERKRVIDNTVAFIDNKPAANILLYGDAGTGKSSTVKAVVNELSSEGLRMIEVRKGQLLEIPELIEKLADNPLKFILFIDDLSFSNNNEEVGALKAILEGSVSAKSSNVVIYATSNRRHLVKESFGDREGDDIHIRETIQEQISLSDRFGLSIAFLKPDKKEYLKIVHGLAKEYKIKEIDNLDLLAERHAMERGGRSGRTARQFVEYLKSIE